MESRDMQTEWLEERLGQVCYVLGRSCRDDTRVSQQQMPATLLLGIEA